MTRRTTLAELAQLAELAERTQKFCKAIGDEVTHGFGFVPFVGSGLSAPSGILTGQESLDYLSYCVKRALDGKSRWNPRRDKWPDIETGLRRRAVLRPPTRPKDRTAQSDRDYAIRREAFGCTANWRSALHFLSRLDWRDSQLALLGPDRRVTDSFFLHVTAGRFPNAAHVMLAHLADPLCVRAVLTTNFDSLIEDAFDQVSVPLVPFDVHHDAGLPDGRSVLRQRSIVKLHGGRYGLRADYSLDEMPKASDLKEFLSYLAFPSVGSDGPQSYAMVNHLLVLGASGDDVRTIELLKSVTSAAESLRIYWVCYDEATETAVRGKLPEAVARGQVITIVQPETGLFLFELYQRLTFSLPPGAANYPAFWTVPPYPYDVIGSRTEDRFIKHRKRLLGAIERAGKQGRCGLVAAYGKGGVSSVASCAYFKLAALNHCIWLDLSRLYGEEHLFAMMTSAIAQKLGMPLGVPITLGARDEYYREELAHYVKKANRPIIMFLNGRDGPDFFAAPAAKEDWESKAWFRRNGTARNRAQLLWEFLEKLSQKKITFVVLMHKGIVRSDTIEMCPMAEPAIELNTADVANKVEEWLAGEKLGHRDATTGPGLFVYAMTLFRYAIHPSALSSWGLMKAPVQCRCDGDDNDIERAAKGEQWLQRLTHCGAVRHRPGGFVWMHSRVREELWRRLDPQFRLHRSECHEGIADWYAKLFRSSNDPCAALESLRHRMHCARTVPRETKAPYRLQAAFVEAISTLRAARDRILSCGYSRPFAAFVEDVAEEASCLSKREPSLAGGLRHACLEILRDLYREVADFSVEIEVITRQSAALKKTRENGASGSPGGDRASNPLAEMEMAYERSVAEAGLRQYRTASRQLLGLLRRLQNASSSVAEMDVSWIDQSGELAIDIPYVRGQAREWLRASWPTEDRIKLMIRCLRRVMFLKILQAELLAVLARAKGDILSYANRLDVAGYAVTLQKSELVYVLATELMRHVRDHRFLGLENTRIRTHYGVLLGNLKRYREGNRRLNEASAYLFQTGEPRASISSAIVDLRRTELLLVHCCDLLDSSRATDAASVSDLRPCLTLANQAQLCLDRARRHMIGHRKNVWWWSWGYELQIATCHTVASIKLAMGVRGPGCWGQRRHQEMAVSCLGCVGEWGRCRQAVDESERLIRLDPMRQARLLELSLAWVSGQELGSAIPPKSATPLLKELLVRLRVIMKERQSVRPVEPELREYVDLVMRKARLAGRKQRNGRSRRSHRA